MDLRLLETGTKPMRPKSSSSWYDGGGMTIKLCDVLTQFHGCPFVELLPLSLFA
jgi:hypothetical protein